MPGVSNEKPVENVSVNSTTWAPVGIAGTGEAMAKGTKFPKRVKVIMEVGEIMQPPTSSGKRVTVGDRARFSAELGKVLQELMDEACTKQAAS